MASRKWLERTARNRNVVVGILSRLRLRNGLGFPVLEVLELPINKVTALHYAREAAAVLGISLRDYRGSLRIC